MTTASGATLATALAYHDAGLSVLPVATDGSKAPDWPRLPRVKGADGKYHPTWERFQRELPQREAVEAWFRGNRPPGIGVISGAVSGGLECLDFDSEAETIYPAWCELVEAEAPGLIAQLSVARTPRGGYHVRFRFHDGEVPGNTKVAMDPAAKAVLIETRGEGGYAVAPGSPAECHKTGRPYEHFSGPRLEQVQVVSSEERAILIRCARSFDRSPPPDSPRPYQGNGAGPSAGDDFDQRGPDWAAILEPHGWVVAHQRAEVTYWRRPGKDAPGWSATTGACVSKSGRALFAVFSSNAAPFPGPEAGRTCSVHGKFATYALLNHRGDFSATARTLAERGYGQQRGRPSVNGSAGKKPGDGRQDRRERPSESSESSDAKTRRKVVRPLPPYVPFPVEHLPPVMRQYSIAAAEAIGCDVALVALPMLAVAAGAIGNSRAVCLKKSWIEPAVVWAGTIAESGGHKSPAYHAAVNPLFELQMDEADEYKAAVEEHKKAKEEWAAKNKEERGDEPKAPPEPPSRVTSDVTIETLGELLRDATRGLLVARDELDGWFQSFTRYKGKGGGNDRANWLELHSAKPLKVDRMTRDRGPLRIRRACASVCGTIQPGTLARALDSDALQAGMGARFLLAMPPRKRRVWTERDVSDELSQQYHDLLKNLLALPLKNEARRDPFVRGLSSLAKEAWVRFYNEWGSAQHAADGEQAAAMAKLEGYAPRLALIHHVVSHVADGTDDATPILQGSMQAGITLARWFANEASRVYAMLHEDESARLRRRLLEWIAAHGEAIPSTPPDPFRPSRRGVTVQALQNSNSRRWPTSETAESELVALVADRLGEWVEDAPRPGGGKRKRWFVLSNFASDNSDDCSGDREPGEDDPSDDCSDDCSDGTGDAHANPAANPSTNGTYQRQPGEDAEQSSELSDANSESE
jgi:hypothetical protein